MGRLTKGHLVEAAIWLSIVAVFYAYSFEFNQVIEIYIFGATAWPRTVLFLLLLATLGNLYHQYKNGSDAQGGIFGAAADDVSASIFQDRKTLIRMGLVLLIPFAFAFLLRPVGIYFSAPFFIAAIMLLFGERRWKAILIMTVVIYIIFIGLFLVILNAQLPQGNVSPFYDFSAWMLKMNTQLRELF
ncbi:MAG: tripartite tricarboxylate transporter TctB family protein [Litoreibacter sp.]|nr:tripartite tricarboxylate transporter TctB family protein [Litoreibacter sp.]